MNKIKMVTFYDKKVTHGGVKIKKKGRKMKMIKQGAGVISEYGTDVLKLKLTGEIDHHNARSLKTRMDGEIFMYRPKRVELDLSSVDFMDSSGLGLILGRYAVARELGGKVSVADPPPEVEKILRLAGTDKLVTIKKSEVVK